MAYPGVAGEWPTVLLVGGAKGLSSPLRDLCRRLARHGFAAMAPDLFAQKPVPADHAGALEAFSQLDQSTVRRVLRDLGRYLDDAAGPWDTDDNGFGVIAVQEGALHGLRTAIDFGAPLVLMAPNLREPSPGLDKEFKALPAPPGVIEGLGDLAEPVLGLIGREDDVSPLDDVMAARQTAPHSQWVIYDGVGHDFLDDNEPGFDQAAFADAFDRTVEFFEKNL
jgi:carboxymethylenebutenolidase